MYIVDPCFIGVRVHFYCKQQMEHFSSCQMSPPLRSASGTRGRLSGEQMLVEVNGLERYSNDLAST